jgi:hypothetical protein
LDAEEVGALSDDLPTNLRLFLAQQALSGYNPLRQNMPWAKAQRDANAPAQKVCWENPNQGGTAGEEETARNAQALAVVRFRVGHVAETEEGQQQFRSLRLKLGESPRVTSCDYKVGRSENQP